VPGLTVGHAEAPSLATGTTVILPDAPAVAALDVRGGGPGTRESDALAPASTVEQVHGLVLSGGSAYGLDAAGGVMACLREQGRGFAVGEAVVPIVPAVILFDLLVPDPATALNWQHPPWWDLGYAAAQAAGKEVAQGNVGAGLGATAGPLKGGIGTASIATGAYTVAALVAVNALGSPVMPGTRCFWTWWLERSGEGGGEAGGVRPPSHLPEPFALDPGESGPTTPRTNTTLAVVATDAALTRPQAQRVAMMAQTGLARSLRPAHSPLDGDAVFALSTARAAPPTDLGRLGQLGADALSLAIMRAVVAAEPLGAIPAWRDLS
ncbi:MAG: P1 family peptidase, partial [Pseudomonadota bacterium]